MAIAEAADEGPHSAAEVVIALIDQMTPKTGSFIPSEQAKKLYDFMKKHQAEVLDEWLHDEALKFLTQTFSARLRSLRAVARREQHIEFFGELADGHVSPDQLHHFQQFHEVSTEHLRKRVADMTGADHTYVAEYYGRREQKFGMLKAFHHTIADMVGGKKTSEVLTEDQYDALYHQIVSM